MVSQWIDFREKEIDLSDWNTLYLYSPTQSKHLQQTQIYFFLSEIKVLVTPSLECFISFYSIKKLQNKQGIHIYRKSANKD